MTDHTIRTGILTVSDRGYRGEYRDLSGPVIRQLVVEKLGATELVSMGSSLKLCLVAEGAADVYPRLGLTSEWDTAAAQAVVECAGGQVINVDGSRLAYNAKEDILNPYFLVFGDTSRDWTSYL